MRSGRWAVHQSGPVAIYQQEQPRGGWAAILLLAERLASDPPLLPTDPEERTWTLGLSHEILGEGGLAWTRRLQLVHAGLQDRAGFPARVASYLGKKCPRRRNDRFKGNRHIAPRRSAVLTEINRAKAGGELSRDADGELVIDAIFGAVYYRRLLRTGPLTEQFGDGLVEQVLRGVRPRAPRLGVSRQ